MKFRKCNQVDITEIIKLGRSTYYDTFHALNRKDTMDKYLDESFNPKKIENELNNPDSVFYFLYDNDLIVAYMKVNFPNAQTDINDLNSLELERIYVKKEYKGLGYGKAIIAKTISIAKEHGCNYVWLGVWEKNKHAIAFYQKMGFEIFDKHIFRMGDELQNDFILKKLTNNRQNTVQGCKINYSG